LSRAFVCFFQAEDGIRDRNVTGVQTCALPISEPSPVFQPIVPLTPQWSDLPAFPVDALPDVIRNYVSAVAEHSQTAPDMAAVIRSEERRVGKEGRNPEGAGGGTSKERGQATEG